MRAQSSSGTSQMVSKGGTGFFLRPMANTSQDFDHIPSLLEKIH